MYFGALHENNLSTVNMANTGNEIDTFFSRLQLYEHSRYGVSCRMGTAGILEGLG